MVKRRRKLQNYGEVLHLSSVVGLDFVLLLVFLWAWVLFVASVLFACAALTGNELLGCGKPREARRVYGSKG
jgi:hypothetical protein